MTVDTNSQPECGHLLGLRGFLVIQSFLWVFLQTFVPVAVKDSANASGPTYEKILRQSLSGLFWNDSLIYSSFIFLSARTICLPFLENPSKTAVASAVFRRGLRLWFPVASSLAIIKILSSTIGTSHLDLYKRTTQNLTLEVPYEIPNTLAYFNSVFNLFWTNKKFFSQAGNTAFPSQTLWIINVIYAQSYTVYLTMIITPYTRDAWRVKAYLCFILSAWWVQSWAWYSVTGLLLTDAVLNMRYAEKAKHGIKIWRTIRCPIWLASIVLMAAGLVMQFLWVDWRPQYKNKELLAHAARYDSSGLNTYIDPKEPEARDDDYLLIVGFHLLLECSTFVQKIFQTPFFKYPGRRSLSKLSTPYFSQSDIHNTNTSPRRLLPRPKHHHLFWRDQTLHVPINAEKTLSRSRAISLSARMCNGRSRGRRDIPPLSGQTVEAVSADLVRLGTDMIWSFRSGYI